MTTRTGRLTVLAVVLAALLGAGLTLALVNRGSGSAADTTGSAGGAGGATRAAAEPTAARTALPALVPAVGEPTLPALRTTHPRPGTVAQVAGPFVDRYELSGLELEAGRLRGVLTVTSDVSDVLELQVLAGFYDAEGRLLATRRFVHHGVVHDEAAGHAPEEKQRFEIAVPQRARVSAVAAAVGVPVLVNE